MLGSFVSILLGHMGFALKMLTLVYWTLIVAFLIYALEIPRNEKK